MRKTILFAFALMTALAMNAQQDATVKFVLNKNQSVKIKSAFTQTNTDPVMKKTEQMKGTLTFNGVRQMEMIYSQPDGDKFVIDGNTLERVKGKTKNKVDLTKVKNMAALADLLCNSMMGRIEEIQTSTGCELSYTAGKLTHNLTFTAPKKGKKSYYKQVELHYDKKSGRIVYMKLTEMSGKSSEYTM